jgi:long-chain acyl-CoA synthetase
MSGQFVLERMRLSMGEPAIVTADESESHAGLVRRAEAWRARLADEGVPPGAVVSIEGDYTAESVAAFLGLMAHGAVIVPMALPDDDKRAHFLATAEAEWRVLTTRGCGIARTGVTASHPLYRRLRQAGAAGLVLFSSGSTGASKGVVHDLEALLAKFQVARRRMRTLLFLLFDHIGGINTLFYTLSNGGTVVVSGGRSPDTVCEAIARHGVELLPTSPSFLNLLLVSGACERHDLRSLKLVTYGTEPMPEATLARAREAMPWVDFQQTYGLTEIGILRSKSRPDGSLWVKLGGEGYETKIKDQRLWVRAASAMLGYLNAPSPFDAEGFLDTGDLVEVDGEWLRILGRQDDRINVGGEKVHPTEVENVLLQMPNVVDAVVFGQPHPLMGQIVAARLSLASPEAPAAVKARVRAFCGTRLAGYKVPLKVAVADTLHSARFKRMRRPQH